MGRKIAEERRNSTRQARVRLPPACTVPQYRETNERNPLPIHRGGRGLFTTISPSPGGGEPRTRSLWLPAEHDLRRETRWGDGEEICRCGCETKTAAGFRRAL